MTVVIHVLVRMLSSVCNAITVMWKKSILWPHEQCYQVSHILPILLHDLTMVRNGLLVLLEWFTCNNIDDLFILYAFRDECETVTFLHCFSLSCFVVLFLFLCALYSMYDINNM